MYIIAPRINCNDLSQINSLLHTIVRDRGEGVILRKSGSLYEQGRNTSLVKLKVCHIYVTYDDTNLL